MPDTELAREIRKCPGRAGINLHAYEFGPLYDTPAPTGYKVFYISHYGRHGSRSTDGLPRFNRIKTALEAAQAEGQLTPQGEFLLGACLKAIDIHAGMDGRLTPRGRREHAMIAERMYRRYPGVFKKGSKKIFAVSSMVPRCIVSMNAFTNRLQSLQKDLEIDLETGENYAKYLTRAEGTEIKELTKPVIDSLYDSSIPDTTAIRSTLFKNPEESGKYFPSAYKLERFIFALANTTEAFDMEEDVYGLLDESVIYKLAEQSNMSIYLRQANSSRFGGKRMPRAQMLAEDIITRADEVIAGAPRAADLRFGHDWPLMGILAYLGLEGASDRMTLQEAQAKWVATRYVPFAGNLQIIFYRNKKNDVLVKFLTNEKETRIPAITPVQGPYYRWEDVKAFLTVTVCGEIRADRKDDLIWENEYSGYRAFGPALQAKGEKAFGYDIFTKSVTYPVLHDRYEKALGPEKISFHLDHGDGMDSYGVGPTLGCCTAALVDSSGIVYPWCWKEADILENGPSCFQVRLTYPPVSVNGKEVVEHRLITLESGKRMNRVDLTYDGLDAPCSIVVGIVVHAENPYGYYADGWVIATADLGDRNIGQNGEMYCGAMLPEGFARCGFEPFDTPRGAAIGHVLGYSTYYPGTTFTYYFGSGWSKAGIGSLDEWTELIR